MGEEKFLWMGILFVLIFALAGCQGQVTPNTTQLVEEPRPDESFPKELSPCNLTFDQVGQSVEAAGVVMFVDDTAPEGLYADLEGDNCRVGITVDSASFSTWNEEQQAAFNVGSEITVQGKLAAYPFPDRPDEKQLIIELTDVPAIGYAAEFSPRELDAPSGELCLFPEDQVGQTVTASGEILFVDHQTAAGLYAEMRALEECVYRLWVERTRWERWSTEEQANFEAGKMVEVEGILTLVLREQNIDLSFPPREIE